jgi:glutamate:Na+ symporter, ESS family
VNFSWSMFVDLGLISLALLLATAIRAKVPFFQKFLIPNALTAGFILLPVYNFLLPALGYSASGLEDVVYHCLSLSFISMTLRHGSAKGAGRRIFASSAMTVSTYAIQATLGIGLTLLFMATFMPTLFPSFGFLLALGFGLGPGQSFAIGKGWEAIGFDGGGNLGLVFAALGYIWGCFGGIYLINAARKRGWMDPARIDAITNKRIRTGVYGPTEDRPVGSMLTTESEAIDTMSFNLAAVLGVYLLAYFLLKGLTWLLSFAGPTGMQLATNLWGISFVFAAIVAMLVKKVFATLKVGHTLDDGSLTRVAGVSVDILLSASVAAISLLLLTRYWLPVLIVAVVGGIVTTITVIWSCSRVFREHRFDWTLMIYGNMTGTVSTGLAFLRVIDPAYETPVATEYMYSSGITFVLCIPFILMLNLPGQWFVTGNPIYLWLTLAGLAAYLVFAVVSYVVLAGEHRFRKPFTLWYRD